MTLQDIEKMDVDILLPSQVAAVLGCGQYSINVQARDNPASFGFPVIKIGSRVRIPREGFIRFMKGELPITSQGCSKCIGDSMYDQIEAGGCFCKSCGRRLVENEDYKNFA